MTCLECGNLIPNHKRADSKYCSSKCSRKAKQKRADQRIIENANQHMPVSQMDNSLYGFGEIRELEKDKFTTILDLREKYENQIKNLETRNLNLDFEIKRLKDQKEDLIRTHERELKNASTNTVKETVSAISSMPAVQGMLGSLANNLIPSKGGSLGSHEDSLSEVEKQIIQEIRKMQPEAQQYLVQMLYFLFNKQHDEQMSIFTELVRFMNSENTEDELP